MTGETSPYSGRPIIDWTDEKIKLYDVDGDKIGDVVEVNPDFLIVESSGGFLGFGEERTYYVPRDQIAREEDADWYLSIDKDALEGMDWSQRPSTSTYAEAQLDTGAAPSEQREGTRMVRYEEQLEAHKTAREAGEVVVSKDVVEETRSIDVPVTREEVRVERRPASGDQPVSEGEAFTGDSIRVPVMEEQVEVRKVARPVEEVEISKVRTQDTERVEDTVRKERIDVEEPGPTSDEGTTR